ncbi:NAD(P)H-hydrate dehydratase [Variovorax sp.]|uniref:NAD(P)H-hydrate dehydratase n=1 Tax=Variovorax sp. TaxID=1871043 RepID=UPI002D69A373|nr:NAD(P)H-hydrate dehydratase [Variovorax sp.]HYP85498.1 NAD(P)H-hydrate dehydratase [Variovorax sp.]
MPAATAHRAFALTRTTLRRWPLPPIDADGDKEVRGHVLVVGGSGEIPGAAVLAATAALRAGAGKLTLAVPRRVAVAVAVAMPEARVIPLPDDPARGARVPAGVKEAARAADAVLAGPGMQSEAGTIALVRQLLPCCTGATVVLDALAMSALAVAPHLATACAGVVLTPHAGEMAHLSGRSKALVCADPEAFARSAALRWQACVALKGARTFLGAPDGSMLHFDGGDPGLATSGSGDTLAGLVAGLAARGLPALHAAAWGIWVHAASGAAVQRRLGCRVGFLARELCDEFPRVIRGVAAGRHG